MSCLILIPAKKNQTPSIKIKTNLEKNPGVKVLILENYVSLAEALNEAVRSGKEENILFLGADMVPSAAWLREMQKSLLSFDLVVGETITKLPPKATPYAKLAKTLLHKHSERAAQAKGHALPWGPISNLAITRKLWGKVGHFSLHAGNALDIDWCWRAMLLGARIHFAANAKAERTCTNEREAMIHEFEQFGQGEAWLHRSFAFLLSSEDQTENPLESALQAYDRIRHHSLASKNKSLARALEEIAVAFASGMRMGYERTHHFCSLERISPERAIGWPSGKKETTLFVAGKGITTLPPKMLPIWEAYANGADIETMAHLMEKIFKCSHHEAHHEVEEFCAAITP